MTDDRVVEPPGVTSKATIDGGDDLGALRSMTATSPTSITSPTTPVTSPSSPTNTTSRLSARFKSLTFSFGGGKRSPTATPPNGTVGAGSAVTVRGAEGGVGEGTEDSASTSTTSLLSASVSAFGPGSGSSGGSSVTTSMSEGSSDGEADGSEDGKERKQGTNMIQQPAHFQDEGMRTPSALYTTFDVSHRSPSLLTTPSKSSPPRASSSSTSPSPSQSHPSSPSLRARLPRHGHSTTSFDDITPRAELPPALGMTLGLGSVVFPRQEEGGEGGGGKKTSPLKGRASGPTSENQGTSRNGTIKRRSPLPESSPTSAEHRRSSDTSTNNRSSTSRDSYFPFLDELDNPSWSESSGDSTAMESRRLSAPTDAEISPLSSGHRAIGIGGDHPGKYSKPRRKPSDNEPWPSSSRHGPTPIGFGGMGPNALSHAEIGGEGAFSSSTSSGTGMSMMSNHSAGWANRTLEEYAYAAHEGADTFASGCEISTPLPPPPGYPMMKRSSGGEVGVGGDRRTSRLGWGSASSSREASPVASPSTDGDPRGSVSSSYSASSGLSGPRLSVGSMSSGSSFDPSAFPADTPPEVLADPIQNQGPNPFEGTITIDTNPQRYLISAKLEGFRVEDITIAVKSVNPSSSSASKSSVSSRNSMLIDSGSRKSSASSQSHDGGRDGFAAQGVIPEEGDAQPGIVGLAGSEARQRGKAGKVLHLLADRWDDSAHFERRITFGVDADFSGGVKAKFDGSVLNIEVPRRPAKRYADRLSMASPSTSDPPNFDMRSSSFRDRHGSFPASLPSATQTGRRTSEWDLGREERYAAAKMMDWQAHSDVRKE